ncbi:MAG: A/G-specific adenine glycosylase [Kiritimatiellia bacterium]|jgi:A/G-specific adenine glycosylase
MPLTEELLAWYDAHKRRLPWRDEPTPYRVLLSELMLQQTRVDTVIPYFERFLARWPTLHDLANADPDEILEQWAGLGYYRRARSLHAVAKAAVEAGGLSGDVQELRALPGIGPYTAGAIASIAFGTCTPLVDGNVERVLCRLYDMADDPRKAAGRRAVWGRAEALVPADRPGDFNQALMELGATICKPRSPLCDVCPLSARCAGQYRAERLPNKPPRKPPVPIEGVAGLIPWGDSVLLARRPAGLLGGMWEPPGLWPLEGDLAGAVALEGAFLHRLGLHVRSTGSLGTVVHVFSHRRLSMQVFRLELVAAGEPAPISYYTSVGTQLKTGQALSRLSRKVLALR